MSDEQEVYSVTDSFTREVIAFADTDISDEQEEQLKEFITELFAEEAGASVTEDVMGLSLLAFVAGRAYQKQFSTVKSEEIPLMLSPQEAGNMLKLALNALGGGR